MRLVQDWDCLPQPECLLVYIEARRMQPGLMWRLVYRAAQQEHHSDLISYIIIMVKLSEVIFQLE